MDRKNKGGLVMLVEALLSNSTKRNVEVSFSLLGKGKDFDITVQKSLYEFDENIGGPIGPVYVVINSAFLHDYMALADLVKNKIAKELSSIDKPKEL